MTKMKSLKKALITSAVSMVLCSSMFVGTTYAWFTDSVTSGINTIVAGTLDVELYHDDKGSTGYEKVEAGTKLFDDIALWEPGAVVYENLKITNEGNLALKFKLSFEAEGTLTSALKVAVVENGFDGDRNTAKNLEYAPLAAFEKEGTLAASNETVYGVVIYWEPTANDNQYNTATATADIGVQLLATQLTAEKDSFDDQYDVDAKYTAEIDQLKANLAAAQSGDTVEYALTHDAYIDSMIKVPNGVTLVLNGNGHQAIVNTAYPFYVNNANIQMNDLTITGKATYAIFTKGATWDYNGNNATVRASFTNVTVDLDKADNYPVVFNGIGEITMTDCTITGAGLSKEGNYRNGTHIFAGAEINLTVSGGTIGGVVMNANYAANSNLTISDDAVIDTLILATEQTKTATLTNNGGTVNKLIQQVDDATKLENALKAGYSVALANDITMEAHISSSSVGDINIYGEDHTLTLRGIFSVGGKNVTLSDMTLVDNKTDDYTIYNQGGKVELTNVTYSSNINKAFQMAGGGEVILTNCNISGEVTGTYSASNIWCGDGRTVTVNGGTYGSIFMNVSEGANVLSASTITVNDGTIGKLILETETNTKTGDGQGYKSAVLVQNGGTITTLVENPQNHDLTGLTKLN